MRKIKSLKRLTLTKETLQNLDDPKLRKAPGQATLNLCTEGTFACSFCHTC
jgi:hypothetical protein